MLEVILNIAIGAFTKHWHKDFSGSITVNFFAGGVTTIEHKETERVAKQ